MGHPITQADVARRAGVSRRLVSAVLHGNGPNIGVRPEKREEIRRIAAELGYRPNVLARSLVSRRTQTLGVVIRNLANPFYGEVVDSLHRVAATHGYDVTTALAGDGDDDHNHQVERLLGRRVDGLLLWSGRNRGSYACLAGPLAAGFPVVMLGAAIADAETSYVAIDRAAPVGDAVRHLAALGHTRIGYVGYDAHPERSVPYETKFDGFRRALDELGLLPGCAWYFEPAAWDADLRPFTEALAEEIAAQPDLPPALFVEGDLLALFLIGALGRRGIRVPDDIALIGYDDIPGASAGVPALTTIAPPTRELAERSVQALMALMAAPERPQQQMIPARLIVRESCGAHPSSPAAPGSNGRGNGSYLLLSAPPPPHGPLVRSREIHHA